MNGIAMAPASTDIAYGHTSVVRATRAKLASQLATNANQQKKGRGKKPKGGGGEGVRVVATES